MEDMVQENRRRPAESSPPAYLAVTSAVCNPQIQPVLPGVEWASLHARIRISCRYSFPPSRKDLPSRACLQTVFSYSLFP
jgi:hypothetical protein